MAPAQGPLEGEDIETEHWEDARHWMSIYDDLIRFKLGLLDRVKRELPKLHPVAQKAAEVDVTFIETPDGRLLRRLDLWYQRVWQLQGLWLDPDGRYCATRETRRSHEPGVRVAPVPPRPPSPLLHLVPDHGICLVGLRLFPEEVRNYVSRVRKILARLEIPCDLVNRPGRGYSLTFRNED